MTDGGRGSLLLAKLVPALYVVGVLLITGALAMLSVPLGLLALGVFLVATAALEVYG